MVRSPYQLTMPQVRSTSVIFASPHSGRDYPASFLRRSVLDAHAIRSSEDAFVDQLFESAPSAGAPLLAASTPRAYLDLNRAHDELDPALIETVRPIGHNPRVVSGLGVVPRVVAGGRSIYSGKITLNEAQRRLRDVWQPYHDQLGALMDESMSRFGEAILIDCHSMPHEAIETMGERGTRRPDVVLGDRFGAAAAGDVVDRIEAAFTAQGLCVSRNAPFAGAFITQHYGRPARGRHAVQVEIDRALYMDERRIRPHAGYGPLTQILAKVVEQIAEIGRSDISLAAE
ncbi:N-formylglutamate amidohydrolase [Profundibacterium mesophilum]|uniref:N-formylglutamate amidohydrolase n=1 Tax=Profundibacterium mesophilum KAUST100406-0324 TaxID=1037889 RepID=A0A921TBE9_9RHOB|nr:N-formylglutamate amidohydrolase [Profundibacterium mesophilum]KAF0675495.1 N-formylglutamate amidohydrolase [Profundibacterium mesophilum KAUST100406-0324]